ncbi:type VI secretion system baseplate subunit TssF [Paraflavitalea speifideaquila]|uniref:type VI secretion system baseplate subunit TssF n=1 Tax=Paraflavitalea speifideaquila TaxID=3076558 RepID=UPI0028F06084|nr:type VI secretion system baseplate subunit TssF [Paraflavitalea speifideiaquila]
MLSDINSSKEVIKNRMIKHALTYWGIRQVEDLDPSVKLILEALSLELYMLGNETRDAQVRILEKIAGLLAPDSLTAPAPAHAILHAAPTEATEWLSNTSSFFMPSRIPSPANDGSGTAINIHFTPVDTVQLNDLTIAYLGTGNNLYAYGSGFHKQLLIRGQGFNAENNTLHLGLKINPQVDQLQNLFFCFDTKNLESKLSRHIYQLLPLSKWYIGNTLLETTPGLQYQAPDNQSGRNDNIFMDYDLLPLIEKDIKHYYNPKYITITSLDTVVVQQQSWPTAFNRSFPANELQKITDKLLWITIVFPAALQQEHLDELYVYPNAFPVINKRLFDQKHRLKGVVISFP